MRETSGQLEEIPGEEGFPAWLESSIKNIYERAGVIRTNAASVGCLPMDGHGKVSRARFAGVTGHCLLSG